MAVLTAARVIVLRAAAAETLQLDFDFMLRIAAVSAPAAAAAGACIPATATTNTTTDRPTQRRHHHLSPTTAAARIVAAAPTGSHLRLARLTVGLQTAAGQPVLLILTGLAQWAAIAATPASSHAPLHMLPIALIAGAIRLVAIAV